MSRGADSTVRGFVESNRTPRVSPRSSTQSRVANKISGVITGAHSIIYSKDSEADRSFFRDILQLSKVDVGRGWLIFGLPPSEIAVHPGEENGRHELYLMCDDVNGFIAEMKTRNISCGEVQDMGWGLLTELTLPGGGALGVYQPRHARPEPMK